MTALVCHVNEVTIPVQKDDGRHWVELACTLTDEHLPGCPGDCRGCLPRPAQVGMLCYHHAEKLQDAVNVLHDLITHVRSVEKGPASVVATHTAPGSKVLIPASWQAADRLWESLCAMAVAYCLDQGIDEPTWLEDRNLTHIRSTATIDDLAKDVSALLEAINLDALTSNPWGTEQAIWLTRDVQTTLTQFPLREYGRQVKHVVCRECRHQALTLLPPLMVGDRETIRCRHCNTTWEPDHVTTDMNDYLRSVIEWAQHRQDIPETVHREMRAWLKRKDNAA